MKKDDDKKNPKAKPNLKVVGGIAALLLIITVLVLGGAEPERSAASFCMVFEEEKARLSTFPGDSYPSGVFNEELSNAQEFANSFAALQEVAPEEIQPDITTLQSLYAKIHEDPTQAIAASMSGIEPEENVEEWIEARCENS